MVPISRGVARLFKTRGRQGGFRGEQGVLTGTQNGGSSIAVSIQICNWTAGGISIGTDLSARGGSRPPCPPSGYATADLCG